MTVKELIQELEKHPQDARVMKSNSDGCSECNYDGLESYHDVYYTEFLPEGHYPNSNEKKIVVI